jgi:hypothetical protein
MKASSLCFRAATVIVVIGMAWGIWMGISRDHSTLPAHAHLNLLGWVSLFLIGIYYRLYPSLDSSRIAHIQVWIWIAATAVMTVGVTLVHTGREAGIPVSAISSLVILGDVILFGWLVFRTERNLQTA